MFIQYALDGVILGNENVIPNLIRNLFYSEDKISKIIILVIVLILINITIFVVIFAVAQTLKLNSTVGIFIAIICGLIVLLSIWYFKISKPLVEDTVEMNKEVISKTTIGIEESKMLKIFNRKDKEIEEFSKMNTEYKRKDMKLERVKVLYVIETHTLRNFKEPFILLWGGILVVNGELTLATISILLTYATEILDYVYESVDKLKAINEFIVAYKKLSQLMKLKEDKETKPDIPLDGDIVFENVTIKLNDNTILQNLNFTIRKNENVAIIGDNGAGKTVISKTMLGFYNYTGNIFIGKYNIKEVSKKSLRDYIGIVLQDTYLYTDTIQNNINITNRNIDDRKIIEVLKLADIYEDIKNFDDTIDYKIGKGRNNISGGKNKE